MHGGGPACATRRVGVARSAAIAARSTAARGSARTSNSVEPRRFRKDSPSRNAVPERRACEERRVLVDPYPHGGSGSRQDAAASPCLKIQEVNHGSANRDAWCRWQSRRARRLSWRRRRPVPRGPAGTPGVGAAQGPKPTHADLDYAPPDPATSNGHKLDLYIPTGVARPLAGRDLDAAARRGWQTPASAGPAAWPPS